LLNDNNEQLSTQSKILEAQNDELEVQNQELVEAHQVIKNTQDQLVQSEKMASMGQVTAAILHEINTPLGAVSSNVQMMEMILEKLTKELDGFENTKVTKGLKAMSSSATITFDAVQRVHEITMNLKNFSRIDQAEFKESDVHEGINSVLMLTSNLWTNHLIIDKHYGELPAIRCYPSLLNQVFMNIIVNAVHATEKDGKLEISSSLIDDYVRIEFKDDGTGIPEDKLEQIFESGFTMKDVGKGTGLGLSISKDIVDKHKGRIYARNNEDQGATFIVELPIEFTMTSI